MSEFHLPKIEIRSKLIDGVKQYVVKGYATTADNIYGYNKQGDKNFREYFTSKALENISRKAKSSIVFADYGHKTGFGLNLKKSLENIETRSGLNLTDEKEYLKNALQISDVPMFKVENLQIDDKGLFVEIRGNPFYREVDTQHKDYFDAVWNSLEDGFINGMSLNMSPTDFEDINPEVRKINDVDFYGVSLTAGNANDMATITEVAMRCCTIGGETKCQNKIKRTTLMM